MMFLFSRGHEQYGYCQAGTSGFVLDDDSIVMGSPGSYTWRGTTHVTSISSNYLERDKTIYFSPISDHEAPVDKYSYLGDHCSPIHSSPLPFKVNTFTDVDYL